jgi:hypothetical protein
LGVFAYNPSIQESEAEGILVWGSLGLKWDPVSKYFLFLLS